jgi:Protein of unknown function (DUF4199)
MENMTIQVRNKMCVKYGLIIGLVYMVLFSVSNLVMSQMMTYYAVKLVVYVIFFVMIGVFLTQVKKADGGYLEFKDAFGAAFVMILVAEVIYFIYSYVYFQYIDPHYLEKMKVSVITYMENKQTPDKVIETTIQNFDTQIADSKHFNLGKTLMGFFGFLIMDSLFAMIVCLIVKKQRPMFE